MSVTAGGRMVKVAIGVAMVSFIALPGFAMPRMADAASDMVAKAKAAVAEYAGPQTTWKGPTSGPKPAKGMKIVYLSGDEQNDISHEYGVYIQQAAAKIGWSATVIDGKGSPTSWLAGMDQAIALKPNGIVMFADAKSLQPAITRGLAEGVKFVGIHAAGLPGPQPDLHLFVNIEEDPRAIGKAEADWAIADSNGSARVVLVSHNEYAIAFVKSHASEDHVKTCSTCKVLQYVTFPASEASQHMPQLTTSWVQRFGPPFYGISVGDNDWDYAIPTLRQGNVSPDQVKLIGADGNKSAYERIRDGGQYQTVTVSEPFELQAWQAVDELNRAFHNSPPSGFVQAPYLVTPQNVHSEGGDKNLFVPSNDYKTHYLKIWGAS